MLFRSFHQKLACILLFLLPIAASATNKVVHYGSEIVEISGTLDVQTFPGLPNFESLAKGDEIERGFYLKLDKSIDVNEAISSPDAENEKNVCVVQIIVDGSTEAEEKQLWSRFREAGKGTHVVVKGHLLHRQTGHHHSRVLLEVTQSPSSSSSN